MISKDLANFIKKIKYSKLNKNVVDKVKCSFLDFFGVALRGSREKSGIIAFKSLYKKGKNSTVIGYGKSDEMTASLINGIFAHNTDLDDGHRNALMHPACTVIPAALSLAEKYNVRGKRFIEGIVCGYEVGIAIGISINPEHRERGFHTTGTCGVFAAAAAASKVLNLKKNEIVNAIGLAGTQASGLLESDHAGTMAKHLHAGKAAQSGVISAILAKNGFTGAKTILDGKEGFFNAYSTLDKISIIKRELGKFHIRNTYMKKYPVCRHLHSTLDSGESILKELGIKKLDPNKVKKIIVETYEVAAQHNNYRPKTVEAVRQSLPVSLAILLYKGDLSLENLKEYERLESGVKKIIDKIIIKVDKSLDANKRPSKVCIEFKNRKIEKFTPIPRGEPENPFSKEDILKKFKKLNPEYPIKKLKIIDELEDIGVGDLMEELSWKQEQ